MTRIGLLGILGGLGLVALSAVSAVAILQACALNIGFLKSVSGCKDPAVLITLERLDILDAERASLEQRIAALEHEIAGQQCTRAAPDPTLPLPDDFWQRQDLADLYGCWQLDTTYRTRNIDTGAIREYSDWQICFDASGNGRQAMRANDGTLCEGPIQSRLSQSGLELVEPGNLSCNDGGFIYERQITCGPDDTGRAICNTYQPETEHVGITGFSRP